MEGRKPACWVLGVEARLDGVPPDGDPVLGERDGLAVRDPELPLDEVGPGHELGHRVLDLEPGVHLHEPELAAAVEQKLDRPRPLVADGPGRRDRGLAHRRPQLALDAGCGRLLDHFLVPALGRAVPLEEVHEVSVAVREHLHLDVPGLCDETLDEHRVVAEGRRRLALRPREGSVEIVRSLDGPHAAPAAPCGRLEQHRPSDCFRLEPQPLRRLVRARDSPARVAPRPRP